MSNTRHAKPGSPFRQERFASSFDRGLMANLVAKRVAVLDSLAEREMVWFIQWLSWQPGGMDAVLKATGFFGFKEWCLDPDSKIEAGVLKRLAAFRASFIKDSAAGYTTTQIGRQIGEALGYTQSARTVTVIDGPSRIGKSFAVRQWCHQSAGLARYAQVPSSSDEQSFLRAIARALGVSIHSCSKAVELRARIEETLQSGDLMLVLDEAAYLYSQTWQRYAQPARVNWIMTALANFDVPVALVSCPHFYAAQTRTEKLTGWNSAQFIGRIGHVERLPESLSDSDLRLVAAAILPEGNARTWCKLAIYARISQRHLASIEAIVKRARWLAARDGRQTATAKDVDKAIDESVIPSDSALTVALQQSRRGSREASAEAPPALRDVPAETPKTRLQAHGERLLKDAWHDPEADAIKPDFNRTPNGQPAGRFTT